MVHVASVIGTGILIAFFVRISYLGLSNELFDNDYLNFLGMYLGTMIYSMLIIVLAALLVGK